MDFRDGNPLEPLDLPENALLLPQMLLSETSGDGDEGRRRDRTGQTSTSFRSGLSFFLAGEPSEGWFGEPDSQTLLGNNRLGIGGVPGNYPLPAPKEQVPVSTLGKGKGKDKGKKSDKSSDDETKEDEAVEVLQNDRERSRSPIRNRFTTQASSKLRELISGAWWSPKKSPEKGAKLPWNFQLPSLGGGRKDLPMAAGVKQAVNHKDKLSRALAIARKLKEKGMKNPPIVKYFNANSSKDSKDAKKKTTLKIIEEFTGQGRAMPLNVDLLLNFASALKEGGYTAGDGYLIEAKLLHIEEGHGWNEQLDRCYKQCKRALARGKGPRKKAPEIQVDKRDKPLKPQWNRQGSLVKFGTNLFIFAMVWMLREIELAAMYVNDVLIDYINKRVTVTIRTSKMDAESKGVRRTLQCLCQEGKCHKECPFEVSAKLVGLVENFNGTDSKLALTKRKSTPSKYAMVNTWKAYYGSHLTGHSARRTGALKYIREGWSVSQVAHLGRWKSSAILLYAEEAMEDMPANLYREPEEKKNGQVEEGINQAEFEEYKGWTSTLKEEVAVLKKKMTNQGKELEKATEMWQTFEQQQEGTLPNKVLSIRTKVVHLNMAKVAASPAASWRTYCGWHFYGNNFVFEKEIATVTCQKCLAFCAKQWGDSGQKNLVWNINPSNQLQG